MRKFAVIGLLVGGVIGVARGAMLHLPTNMIVLLTIRFGIAGAAAGASIPAALRVLVSLLGAAIWLVLVLLLWFIAMVAVGAPGLQALLR